MVRIAVITDEWAPAPRRATLLGKDNDDHRIGSTEDIGIHERGGGYAGRHSRDGGPASPDLRHRTYPRHRLAQAAIAATGKADGGERRRDREGARGRPGP